MSQKVKKYSENDKDITKGHRTHLGEDYSSAKSLLILTGTVNIFLFISYINKTYLSKMSTVNVKVYS